MALGDSFLERSPYVFKIPTSLLVPNWFGFLLTGVVITSQLRDQSMEVLGGGNDLIVKIKVPLLGKYQTMASSNATLGVGWWYMLKLEIGIRDWKSKFK